MIGQKIYSKAGLFISLLGLAQLAIAQPDEYNLRYLGGTGSAAYGVNDDFVVCGSQQVEGFPQPFVWDVRASQNGLLPLPSTQAGGIAHAISNQGIVVGERSSKATVWIPENPDDISAGFDGVEIVFPVAPSESTARGVDDAGNVVGWKRLNGLDSAFFRTPQGTFINLPPQVFVESRAYAIATGRDGSPNEGKTYVAGAVRGLQGWQPARWTRLTSSSQFVLEPFSVYDGFAFGVNRFGHIVGAHSTLQTSVGFVSTSGTTVRDLVPTAPYDSGAPTQANDINDDGRVVGVSQTFLSRNPFFIDVTDGPIPAFQVITTSELNFGYGSGVLDSAYSVCDIDPLARSLYIPAISMRGRAPNGVFQAVLARPKKDSGGGTGRASGGVAAFRMANSELTPGQGGILQLGTSYCSPATGIFTGDYQAEQIMGYLKFTNPLDGDWIELGGQRILNLTIEAGSDKAPPNEEGHEEPAPSVPNNVQASREDAGKRVRVSAVIKLAYVGTLLERDISIAPLPTTTQLQTSQVRWRLGDPMTLRIRVKDTIFPDNQNGIGAAEVLCRLTNPASGGPPVLFDCSDEQGEPVPKRTNAQGIVEFSAEVPRAVGVSHPGNPIYAEFFVKAMTQGTVFPHYKAPAVARQDLDIYSDTRVSVPDAFAYPGELVPISATLSDAATGTAVPGRELLFHLVVGGQTSDIQATTSVNGVATIMYQTPVGSPLPLIGNFPVLVTFAGDPGPNPAYPASEGIGRLRIGYKGLRLEEYAISAASSLILPNPLDARSTWTLEGTLGQSAIGLPDDPASATVRAQLGFWRTARNLIKKIHWP